MIDPQLMDIVAESHQPIDSCRSLFGRAVDVCRTVRDADLVSSVKQKLMAKHQIRSRWRITVNTPTAAFFSWVPHRALSSHTSAQNTALKFCESSRAMGVFKPRFE